MKEERVEKKYSNRVTKKTSHQKNDPMKVCHLKKFPPKIRFNESTSLKKLPVKKIDPKV